MLTARQPNAPRYAEIGRRAGFSLVELLVVMGLVGLLLAIAMPAVTRSRQAARRTECLNNLRNLALGLTMFDETHGRLPASGNYFDGSATGGGGAEFHSWAVAILPWVDQGNVSRQWDFEKSIADPVNAPLTRVKVPVFICPSDLSRSPKGKGGGDLSYVVNGGVGFTIRTGSGVGDCPIHPSGPRLDLNGDGQTCTGTEADDEDRLLFKRMGLFFLENWKSGGTERHYALADIGDGTSQTMLLSENARTGYNPEDESVSFASSNPYLCAYYIGNPCRAGDCRVVDYSQCNAGEWRINSGIRSPEGESAIPNSFHDGGVHMAFADGHVTFMSEGIDGAVYAALASPQGRLLSGTPLEQAIAPGGSY